MADPTACHRVGVKERHRHTETVELRDGTRWLVESYRPRLSVPGMFLTSGAPFDLGEWLDWMRSRNRWLVAIRSASGTGRVRWWQRVDNGGDAERLRREIAEKVKSGSWP